MEKRGAQSPTGATPDAKRYHQAVRASTSTHATRRFLFGERASSSDRNKQESLTSNWSTDSKLWLCSNADLFIDNYGRYQWQGVALAIEQMFKETHAATSCRRMYHRKAASSVSVEPPPGSEPDPISQPTTSRKLTPKTPLQVPSTTPLEAPLEKPDAGVNTNICLGPRDVAYWGVFRDDWSCAGPSKSLFELMLVLACVIAAPPTTSANPPKYSSLFDDLMSLEKES